MNASYRLTVAAAADLFQIYRYTVQHWGEAQADRYQRELHRHLSVVTENPLIGTAQDEIRKHVRKYLAESHAIYYRRRARDVEILRVLHVRQDAEHAFRRR